MNEARSTFASHFPVQSKCTAFRFSAIIHEYLSILENTIFWMHCAQIRVHYVRVILNKLLTKRLRSLRLQCHSHGGQWRQAGVGKAEEPPIVVDNGDVSFWMGCKVCICIVAFCTEEWVMLLMLLVFVLSMHVFSFNLASDTYVHNYNSKIR